MNHIEDLDPKYRVDGSCFKFIPVTSYGIFSKELEDIFRHHLIVLELQLALIFTLATIIHLPLRLFDLPRLISEMLTGLILGPTVLGRFFPNVSSILFPLRSTRVLSTLIRFGYLLFMFLIGVKMDVNLIRKSGKREWTIGFVVNFFPVLVNVQGAKFIALNVDKVDEDSMPWISLVSARIVLTSFPVVAILLMHLKIINSELGHITLSASLISHLIGVAMVNLDIYREVVVHASLRVVIKSVVLTTVLLLFILTVLRQMLYWIIHRTPEGKPVKDAYIYFVVMALLVIAIFSENVGLKYMYGPFIFGLIVPNGHPLASTLVEKLDTIVSGWILPLLSTYCGYASNLWELGKRPPCWIIFLATFGFVFKTICGLVPALWFKMPIKDATAVALMLGARGIVDLGVLAEYIDRMSDVPQTFSYAIMLVFISALVAPILTRNLYDPSETYKGYQKRTVLDSSPYDGVRMLACAHREQDALSAIKLLQLSNPTTGSPLSVYGLYLEELVGGSSPILLNHQLGQKDSSEGGGRWQPIIGIFNYFKSQCRKPTHMHLYTAISPPSLMHEDVCWVSFTNSVALIILPFHKQWNAKGNVISDSKVMREFNAQLLNKAPCSVGILIDRDQGRRSSSIIDGSSAYNVCLFYVGGKDDREALAIARRMRGWRSVYLTVVRFKAINDSTNAALESKLDDEFLRDIRCQSSNGKGNVLYKEEKVRDGVDTAVVIRDVLDRGYDLIIAGVHSKYDSPIIEGLSMWKDLPELGVIGDMLASSEITKPVSAFVVQQQVIEK